MEENNISTVNHFSAKVRFWQKPLMKLQFTTKEMISCSELHNHKTSVNMCKNCEKSAKIK